jgi:putative transposase
VSTRKVADLVKALGIDGISKTEVTRICKALDQEVEAFLSRAVEDECPYVILDATFHKVRGARSSGVGGVRGRGRRDG